MGKMFDPDLKRFVDYDEPQPTITGPDPIRLCNQLSDAENFNASLEKFETATGHKVPDVLRKREQSLEEYLGVRLRDPLLTPVAAEAVRDARELEPRVIAKRHVQALRDDQIRDLIVARVAANPELPSWKVVHRLERRAWDGERDPKKSMLIRKIGQQLRDEGKI